MTPAPATQTPYPEPAYGRIVTVDDQGEPRLMLELELNLHTPVTVEFRGVGTFRFPCDGWLGQIPLAVVRPLWLPVGWRLDIGIVPLGNTRDHIRRWVEFMHSMLLQFAGDAHQQVLTARDAVEHVHLLLDSSELRCYPQLSVHALDDWGARAHLRGLLSWLEHARPESSPRADPNSTPQALPVPLATFLSTADLARQLELSRNTVDGFLRRFRKENLDCYVKVDDRRRNEPRFLYRTEVVLPELQRRYPPPTND
jgi:hypothetical protein